MDKYEEIKCIGRGAYGSAHLVTLRGTNEKYVVKKIPTELLTEKEKAQSFREVELLAKLKHPNVVEYRENFVEGNVIHIVMAYCDGGDLAEKIRDRVRVLEQARDNDGDCARAYFDIGQILDWFVQMAMAIKYLHQQRILHRDLKTSNIFLTTENVIKLGDFGIAKTLDSTLDQARTVVGTPYYMSPEVCENKPYSYASDVWSLGCVLYEMCALKHAFDAPNIISLIFTIVRKEFAPVPAHFDSEISSLLKLLLDKSPEKRPSMDQIFTIPYIRNHMQGLVASGGSLRANTVARRPLGAPKRRVHAKNMMRRSSVESIKRKPRAVASESVAPPQWIPITPLDADELRQLERDADDLELLDASILEESQLDVRAPERSRTPEPLACFDADEAKPPPAPVSSKRAFAPQVNAWGDADEQVETGDSDDGDGGDGDGEVVDDEDLRSQLHEEAAELMSPNFENAYSEECMDSLQIYYSSKSAKAKSRRPQHGRFRAAAAVAAPSVDAVGSKRQQAPPLAFRASDLAADDETLCLDDDDDQRRVVMKRFPLHVDESIDNDDDASQPPAVATYEQWGRRAAAHGEVALQLVDASLDADDDNVEMRESVDVAGNFALRGLASAGGADSSDDSDRYDDDSDGSDDYTSLSEYEAEENFYSDDSDFYDEDDTQYSDDFDDADAEVIEYANDEFAPDDSVDDFAAATDLPQLAADAIVTSDPSLISGGLLLPTATAATAAAGRSESSLSPMGKKQQKPPTEVQWVMRNVAESLLQSHDDVTVA